MNGPNDLIEIRKKYHHGDLREHLLDAVRQLIEQYGPDGFSIAQACRHAGVSTAAPYKHFKDRHEIMRHVAHQALERMRDGMQRAADAYPAGSPERIMALGNAYVTFAKTEPGMFAVMFSLTTDHAQDEDLMTSGKACFDIVIGVVADHMGLARQSPEVAARAYALWCFVHGHSFLTLDGKASKIQTPLDETTIMALVGRALVPDQIAV